MSACIQAQAATDEQLIELWLHGRAKATQETYRYEIRRFLGFVKLPISNIKLGDVQTFTESLAHLAPASQARAINAIKSLFSFGIRVGYLRWNATAPIKAPKVKNALAERILSEEEVHQIIVLESDIQHRTMLRLLYAGALRISELCGLRWRDLRKRGDAGQITVFGKGGKTGVVLLPAVIWAELQALPGNHSPDQYVFPSSQGKQLNRAQAWRIVKRAAKRAGVEQASCHWFRHCAASHSLERGASIALVQQTLRHSNIATTSKYLHVRPNESSSNFLAL